MNPTLSTSYHGIQLPHPLVVGASPLVDQLDRVRAMEDAGAAAVVMHSLFEEQILLDNLVEETFVDAHEDSFGEATSYFPSTCRIAPDADSYLARIARIKEAVSIPVFASLNGRTDRGWASHAAEIEQAGADALELNLYSQPTSDETPSDEVESKAADIVRSVCASISIPVAVKISPFYTSLPHFARRLESAGARALVIFNRFYQPEINIEDLTASSTLQLSDSSELNLRLRWLAILHGRQALDLACTGGVHSHTDVIKALMSGATTVQMVSTLLLNGVSRIGEILQRVATWMEDREYTSIDQLRGCMSHSRTPNPEAIERANYVRMVTSAQLRDRFGPVKW